MLWLLDHWGDVLSDLSVFHRMSPADAEALPSPRLFDLASRLVYYAGAVQTVAMKAFGPKNQPAQASQPPEVSVVSTEAVDPTPEQIKAMRDAARRRRFGPEYGEHKHVNLETFMGVASGG